MEKVHRVIKSNQNAFLKPFVDQNTDLRKKEISDFEKEFFELMNNAVFRKTMKNVRKHRDIKLVTTDRRRNYLVSEPNYHATKFSTENVLGKEMKKTDTLINKPVYLGLSILELSKTLMYDFWYSYVNSKYGGKAKLCYMATESFIVYIKKDHAYQGIAEDVETTTMDKIFETSSTFHEKCRTTETFYSLFIICVLAVLQNFLF